MNRLSSLLASRTGRIALGAALLAAGGGIGAAVTHAVDPVAVMAPLVPVRIASLAAATTGSIFDAPIVSVRGRVVEVFGDHLIVDDGTGRVMVDGGHGTDALDAGLLRRQVIVQGRYDRGIVRADFVVGPDRRVTATPGRGDHGGGREHHGGGERRGHDDRERNPVANPAQDPAAGPTGAAPRAS